MTEGTPPTPPPDPPDLLHPDRFRWHTTPAAGGTPPDAEAAAAAHEAPAVSEDAAPAAPTAETASPEAPPEEPTAAAGEPAAVEGEDGEGDGLDEEAREDGRPAPPIEQVQSIIEALLFVADGPVAPASLARVIGIPTRAIEGPLEALGEALRTRGLRLQRGPEGIQLVTAPLASSYVEQFLGLESAKRLSTAALETLAIIAYRQPVTRGQVEAIRGVNSDAAIDTLRTRGLVDITGRADTPGRPAIFGTTQRFLEHFGLERPEDLPPLPEEVAGVAAARFRDHGAQLPLPPVADVPLGHLPGHLEPGEEMPDSHEAGGSQLPGEPEQRRPAVEPGPRLPTAGPSLPQSTPGGPPRAPGAGPPRGGLPGAGGAPRFP